MANQNQKWLVNSDGSVLTRSIDGKFYSIYQSRLGKVKADVRKGNVALFLGEYKSFDSAKRAIRKRVKKERSSLAGKHNSVEPKIKEPSPSVTTEPIHNTDQTVTWIKDIPSSTGTYLIYTVGLRKRAIRIPVYDNSVYLIMGSGDELDLKNSRITHYIPLDNINPPKNE